MGTGQFPIWMLGLGVNPCDADAFDAFTALSSAGASPPSSILGRKLLPMRASGGAACPCSPDPVPEGGSIQLRSCHKAASPRNEPASLGT